MKRTIFLALALVLLLAACNSTEPESSEDAASSPGMGMGMQGGMMARHSAAIPEEYAGISNPVPADEASLERGAELYATHCASCHGDGGMGDGPAGTALDPAAAPVAHTSQMLGDDYLFWRISEGGTMAPFNSAMPPWSATLGEQERWDVINYIRALGSGAAAPRQAMGGAAFDPDAEAAQRAEVLATAVAQDVITQSEADTFGRVHTALDDLMAQNTENMSGNMASMQDEMLAELVNAGTITQEQAGVFNDVHNRLLDSGLMQ